MSSVTELMAMDISKMSEVEFRIAIIKSVARLEESINDNIESLRVEMRSNQAKLKDTMNEMLESKLDTLTTRINEAKERISDLEDKVMDRKEAEENKDRQLVANEKRIGEINDAIKHSSVRIIGIPEGVERGLEGIFQQIIAENLPNLGKETSI